MPNPFLDIYVKYIGICLVGFYGISTIVGYLMPNPFLDIYVEYIGFGLVGFYGISTIVGYLMLNPFLDIYVKYMITQVILLITILNESELIFLLRVK